jgi:hypothetical protein
MTILSAANLADPVLELAGREPSATAVITGDKTVSFAQLNGLVWKAAARLRQTNPETVGFRFKDQFLHLVFVLGAFRLGATHVSLFQGWPDRMGIDLAAQCGAGILFGDEAWVGSGGECMWAAWQIWPAIPNRRMKLYVKTLMARTCFTCSAPAPPASTGSYATTPPTSAP